jgi:hypothetical protein
MLNGRKSSRSRYNEVEFGGIGGITGLFGWDEVEFRIQRVTLFDVKKSEIKDLRRENVG